MYGPSARAMKRGVPPTARKARTGELTPPGMTRRARSNSASLVIDRARSPRRRAQWTWRGFFGAATASASPGGRASSPGSPSSSPSPGRAQKKRSGTTLPMPGRKPASSAWSRKASASPTAACSSTPVASSAASAGRERLAGADEGGLEALELLARDRALRRGEHVVEELVGQGHARDEHVARAVLVGGDGELARRRRPLAVPVGQEEVGRASGGCRPAPRSAAGPGRGTPRGRPAARPPRPRRGWAGRRPAARRGSRRGSRRPRSRPRSSRGSRPSRRRSSRPRGRCAPARRSRRRRSRGDRRPRRCRA